MGRTVRLREYLAQRTIIDCDTLNADVPRTLGPFQDCTSNQVRDNMWTKPLALAMWMDSELTIRHYVQAILCGELAHAKHNELIRRCIRTAKDIGTGFPECSHEELILELAALAVQQQIAPNIRGYVHLQVNPFSSYDTDKIVANAKRFVSLCEHLTPKLDPARLCIKIPSTWEGIAACKTLEAAGIRTLATTLCSMEQAALAAEAGCLYIAPYVLELKVHIDPSYKDPSPAFELCRQAQLYYRQHDIKTQVLAASLQTVDELMQLAGVDHITVSEKLLNALADAEDDEDVVAGRSVFKTTAAAADPLPEELWHRRWTETVNDEARFRMRFTRRDGGRAEGKQIQAINVFCDMQLALEKMVREFE